MAGISMIVICAVALVLVPYSHANVNENGAIQTSSLTANGTELDELRGGSSHSRPKCRVKGASDYLNLLSQMAVLTAQMDTISNQFSNQPAIPSDYVTHAGFGSYKYHTTPANWLDAHAICQSEGAELAVINSAAERAIIDTVLASNRDLVWMGLNDIANEGTFVTDGGYPMPVLSYNQWTTDEPDDVSNQDCVQTLVEGGVLGLATGGCASPKPFLCEIPQCGY